MIQNTLTQPEKPAATGHVPLQHQSPFRKWAGLGVLSLGLAIIIIDTTLLNVSLSPIIRDLKTDLQSIQWVITAYALVLAAFTITGGRLGDLFGRKRMFMLGAIIFAVGSFMASESHSLGALLWGESIIEGLGAALMMPATASLVVANFQGPDRAKAFGVWGGVAGASSAIGPLLGGWLTSHYSWRWGFRINILVAAVLVIGSMLLLKDSKDEQHRPTLDIPGILLSALGLLGITYGIIESETYGWWKAKELLTLGSYQLNLWNLSITPFAIAAGILFLVLFLFWERRVERSGRTPLVYLDLFKNRQFIAGSTTVSILTLGMTGMVFALPIFLQAVKQLDAFHTGLAMLPLSVALLITAPVAGSLSRKIPAKYLIQTGLVLDVFAMFILRSSIGVDIPTSHLIPGLIMYGVGMGMVMAPVSNLTLSAVSVQQAGEASGVNNTLRQVGSTLGAALIGAAVLTSLTAALSAGIRQSPIIPSSMQTTIAASIESAGADIEFGQSNLPGDLPEAVQTEIKDLAKQASASATRDAYVYAAMFIMFGLAASLFLPGPGKTSGADSKTFASPTEGEGKKVAGAVLLMAVAVTGAVLLIKDSKRDVIASGTGSNETVIDIQNAFRPEPPSGTPVATTTEISQIPNPSPETPASPAASATTSQLRGQLPPVPAETPYINQALGFRLVLPADWQAQAVSGTTVALSSSRGDSASIQSYTNVDENLSDIERQLRGSQSVRSVMLSQFQGQDSLQFTTASGQHGIALLHGSRLYYIIGSSLTLPPLSSFLFL